MKKRNIKLIISIKCQEPELYWNIADNHSVSIKKNTHTNISMFLWTQFLLLLDKRNRTEQTKNFKDISAPDLVGLWKWDHRHALREWGHKRSYTRLCLSLVSQPRSLPSSLSASPSLLTLFSSLQWEFGVSFCFVFEMVLHRLLNDYITNLLQSGNSFLRKWCHTNKVK